MKFINISISIIFIIFLFLPQTSFAHKVDLNVSVKGDSVIVEGYYPDGKPSANSKIEVIDNKNNIIIEGKTDDAGRFSFTSPETKNLKIVINDSLGHKTEYFFSGKKKNVIHKHNHDHNQKHVPKIKKSSPVPWIEILAGLGFIFGLAGFVLSFSANKKIAKLKCISDPKHDHKH